MIDNFFSINALDSPLALLNIFIIGFTLGWCFEQAGIASSKKTIASFYFKDMSFLKTVFTALLTCVMGLALFFKFGLLSVDKFSFTSTFLWPHSIGGFLFGIGFVMSGWTLSSSIVGLASGKLDAFFFLISAIFGVVLFNETFSLYKVLYNLGGLGLSSVCELFGCNWFSCVALLACIVIFLLWLMKLIDSGFKLSKMGAEGRGLWVFSMFAFIIASFLIVPIENLEGIDTVLALTNEGVNASDTTDDSASLGVVESFDIKEALLDAKIYAQERMLGEKAVVLVDVRPRDEFEHWHINGSYNYPVEAISLSLERYRRFDRIVLVGDEMEELEEVLRSLLDKSYKNVFILNGGLEKFKKDVLFEGTELENLSENEQMDYHLWRALFTGSGQANSAADPLNINSLIGVE